MDFNGFNNFEDFAKNCGYTGDDKSNKSGESKKIMVQKAVMIYLEVFKI